MDTFKTSYGKISIYQNEKYIINDFKNGSYWDIDTLQKLKPFINPNKNILEIGGHCGTSTLVYSSYLNEDKKVFVYEPQKKMFELLVKNINQNNLYDKIIPFNYGVFCINGKGEMNDIDLDGGGGNVAKRYNEESHLGCNFGGIGLGSNGEEINLVTIDSMDIGDIGFIHCDAQGSENFIFSKGKETIKKYRPTILFENNQYFGKYLYDNVVKHYPQYYNESKFDLVNYCMETLKYSKCIHKFNNSIDTLLIP
jgi:FkbM family methyltransferase